MAKRRVERGGAGEGAILCDCEEGKVKRALPRGVLFVKKALNDSAPLAFVLKALNRSTSLV